jgi:NADP-dependent 3-hydroxy acid dehydrogenase YdfG
MARALGLQGARVLLAARSADRLEEARELVADGIAADGSTRPI